MLVVQLIPLGRGRISNLSSSIARLQQSLFIIFVSMEDSYLIDVFGSICLLRKYIYDYKRIIHFLFRYPRDRFFIVSFDSSLFPCRIRGDDRSFTHP